RQESGVVSDAEELVKQPGLAYSGLTGHYHEPGPAAACLGDLTTQQLQFCVATEKRLECPAHEATVHPAGSGPRRVRVEDQGRPPMSEKDESWMIAPWIRTPLRFPTTAHSSATP